MNREEANIDSLESIPSHIQRYIKHLYEKKKQSVSSESDVPKTQGKKFFSVVMQVQKQQAEEKKQQSLSDQANQYLRRLYAQIPSSKAKKNLNEQEKDKDKENGKGKDKEKDNDNDKEKNLKKTLPTYASTNLSIQEIEDEENYEDENQDFNFDNLIKKVNRSEQTIINGINELLKQNSKTIEKKQEIANQKHKKKNQQLVNSYFSKKVNSNNQSSYLLLHQHKALQTNLTKTQYSDEIKLEFDQINENEIGVQTTEKKKFSNSQLLGINATKRKQYNIPHIPIWERVDYILHEKQDKIDIQLEAKRKKEELYLQQFEKKNEEKLNEKQLRTFWEKQKKWKTDIEEQSFQKKLKNTKEQSQKLQNCKKLYQKFENDQEIALKWENFYNRQLDSEINKVNKMNKARNNEFSFQPQIQS